MNVMDGNAHFDETLGRSCIQAVVRAWDSLACGYPVAEVEHLVLDNADEARALLLGLIEWSRTVEIGLVSCRLACDRLLESMILERFGFRFVEVVLHPRIELAGRTQESGPMAVAQIRPDEVEQVATAAEHVFHFERFHIDPRISPSAAARRYGNWIRNNHAAPEHELLGAYTADGLLAAFFLVERLPDGEVAWRLTAVLPPFQGQGFGHKAWLSVLAYHRAMGETVVTTTIAASNTPVLNLYSKLESKWDPAEMTFHMHLTEDPGVSLVRAERELVNNAVPESPE